eukprot:3635340-Pyramimonas_sp.AAC.1
MGARADLELVEAAADALHKAVQSGSGANCMTSQADWDAVGAALDRVIASVLESTAMGVHSSVSAIADSDARARGERCRRGEGVLGLPVFQGRSGDSSGALAWARCGGDLRRQRRRGSQEALGHVQP